MRRFDGFVNAILQTSYTSILQSNQITNLDKLIAKEEKEEEER